MTSDNSRHRLGLLAVAALSLFGALFARLWILQVVQGDTLTLQAQGNATREVIIPAPRGRILDRSGEVLVDNRESIVVGIDAQAFEELSDERQQAVLERLSTELSLGLPPADQVSVEQLTKALADERYSRLRPIPVAEDISEETEIYFAEQADLFPAVVVERSTVRDYRFGSLAAHVLGYVGPLNDDQWASLQEENDPDKPYVQTDEIGKAGVEASYELDLRGTPGRRVYEVDRTGVVVREITSERQDPKPGDDLWLSIDAKVQFKTEEALQARLLASFQGDEGQEAGAMVVMDHDTGQVRAMASYPTYQPADLVGGISCPTWRDLQGLSPEGPCGDAMAAEMRELRSQGVRPLPKLLNRAIQGAYPPASTFKLATAYAALQLQLRTPATTIEDPGFERLCDGDTEGCVKTNAGGRSYGAVDLRKALTVSSDVYFYKIGRESWEGREALGDDAMQRAVEDLGYGARTGIDLPAEAAGSLPTPATEAELALELFEADPEYFDNDIELAKDGGRWRTGFSADFAIGQKANVTPLQSANAYASLANGGRLYVPSVLEKVTVAGTDEVRRSYEPELIREIDWGDARDDFLFAFKGVVDPTGQNFDGTATAQFQGFPFDAMPLGGKTGTAQTGEDQNGNERPDNSLFVAFTLGGPSAWTASAMFEYSGFGSEAAAPAVRMVLEPIATGELASFAIPAGGAIDADAALQASSDISTVGSD